MNTDKYWAFVGDCWKFCSKVTEVSATKAGYVKVRLDEGAEVDVKKEQLLLISETSLRLSDDLILLDELNEPIILYNLEQRFKINKIYTYIGPMIISVNPYQTLNELGADLITDYSTKKKSELPPHLYATSQEAYLSLLNQKMSQSVIISGESGAGKTEATKIILKFLTVVSNGESNSLSESIIATNPILEAFGNAKTTRNNNSSRFGKLIKIIFDDSGRITGATISNYLLESTRIVDQAPSERNYHIFYSLIKGASHQQRTKYSLLSSISDYKYLKQGDIDCGGRNDEENFAEILRSFTLLGFTQEDVDSIFMALSGILHLGNLEFVGTDAIEIANTAQLQMVCDTLQIPSFSLRPALTKKVFTGGGRSTFYSIPLTKAQAIENRDAMAKAIYSKVFDHLIAQINKSLSGNTKPDQLFISVLDIYGFEIFDNNSFEQFCINYANEKLQESFNQHLFKAEQEEYKKEGIPWTEIKFKDNKGCIDMIEKNVNGLIALLNEECQVPKGEDKSFLSKIVQVHGRNPFFAHQPRKRDIFEIRHFAGTVEYNVNGFLEKNKNTLNKDVMDVIAISASELLKKLFSHNQTSKITVSQIFKKELTSLVDLLNSSYRHYVRCLKPNNTKEKLVFDSPKILTQLQNNGVLETVALRKAGYSNKMDIDAFMRRYYVLGVSVNQPEGFLSAHLPQSQWARGKTKLFLRQEGVMREGD